jgi:hypothetical protein
MVAGNMSGYHNAKCLHPGEKGGKGAVARQSCFSPHYNLRQFFRFAGDDKSSNITRGNGIQGPQ